MHESNFEITYEANSKQVRHFNVNSLPSVYRAISANIQDYLQYHGICENVFSFWTIVPTVIVAVIGLVMSSMWSMESSRKNFLFQSLFFYSLLYARHLWIKNFVVPDVIFQGTGKIEGKKDVKSFVNNLKKTGKKLRISLRSGEKISILVLTLQLVDHHIFPRSAKVVCEVKKELNFSHYFSEQGFFYSKTLIHDFDELMEKLIHKYRSR